MSTDMLRRLINCGIIIIIIFFYTLGSIGPEG